MTEMPSKRRSGIRPSQDRTDTRDTRKTIGPYIYIYTLYKKSANRSEDNYNFYKYLEKVVQWDSVIIIIIIIIINIIIMNLQGYFMFIFYIISYLTI